MMSLQVMNPHLVIDHRTKERKIEDLTIELCENNVCTYLMKMQEMRNKIYSLRNDMIKYYKQRFLTLTFNELGKTAGDFLADVKRQRSEWVNKPSAFNTSTFISNMINLYTNYKSTGKWDKQGAEHNKVLVVLDTALKQERSNNKKRPGKPTSSATKTPSTETGNYTSPPAWIFNNSGKATTCPDTGDKCEWCKIHGRKSHIKIYQLKPKAYNTGDLVR